MKTTREAAKEVSHKELVNHLQELLEKNYDAEKGYKKALTETENLNLKEFLKNQAAQRNHFATELDNIIRNLNEEPIEASSALGNLHRTWMSIKTVFTKNDDEAILEECIRGEKASIKEYKERLSEYPFPSEIKPIIKDQLSKLEATIQRVKRLEDIADD